MAKARAKALERWYRGDQVPLSAIRRFARQVAERFQPDKIILFGSQAYGTPHADSDVDILVVMPARNEIDRAARIRWAVPRRFAMDLIVRRPDDLRRRLEEGDWFLREIVAKGKILYEGRVAMATARSDDMGERESWQQPRSGSARRPINGFSTWSNRPVVRRP
jgi:predicted nucleotidyltransferase